MLWKRSPQYEGMPYDQYLQTPEGREYQEATRRWSQWQKDILPADGFDPGFRGGVVPTQPKKPKPSPMPGPMPKVMPGNANLDLLSKTGQIDFRMEGGRPTPYHKDPYGDQIRQLAGSGFNEAERRMIDRSSRRRDLVRAMNPAATGGSTWLPGYGYVPSDSPAVKKIEQDMDLERQRMELERERLELEREQMSRKIGLGADLRGWLAKRLGGGE